MTRLQPLTMVMVDDNQDEIFLTRRQVSVQGIVNHFVSERKPENLMKTLEVLHDDKGSSNILILLDISMPRQGGFETLKIIRENKKYQDLPVIMFSASNDEADMAIAADLGANGYMVKPFALDTFIGALGACSEMKIHLLQ